MNCEQQGEKLTLRLAWLAEKELVTVLGYYGSATTGNRTALKPRLQQLSLRLVNVKQPDNSSLFMLTDQLITTSQNK